MTSEMSQKQQQIEWRRSKVLELSSQGYNQSKMGQKLQVDRVTVHRDPFVSKTAGTSQSTKAYP
jgi:hypothetical protein